MLIIACYSCWYFFICLLNFYLVALLIIERRVVKSPAVIVNLTMFPFNYIQFALSTLQLCCLVYTQLGLLYLLSRLIF